MTNPVELRQEAADLVGKMRLLVNRAEGEKRDLNTEEDSEYKKLSAAVDSLESRIKRIEDVQGKEDDLDQDEASKREDAEDDEKDDPEKTDDRKRNIKRTWEERGINHAVRLDTKESRKKYWASIFPELRHGGAAANPNYRDITLGSTPDFSTPVQLSKDFIVAVNNLSFVRKVATIEQLGFAQSLGVRQMTTQMSASWSGEVTQLVPDTATVVGLRELSPNLVSCLVNISLRMLQAAGDVESIIMDRIQYQMGIKMEQAYIAGTGSGQPLGLFTASSSGIPTTQDVTSTVSLAKVFTGDNVWQLLYSLPQQYRLSPKFAIFGHRSVAQYIRTLKDGVGQYLWSPGIAAGEPATLAGFPFYQSEYAPSLNASSPTASQYVLCCGDMNYYHIADVANESSPQIIRLNERYADLNEVGVLSRFWTDGSPVLANAFARLELAAS